MAVCPEMTPCATDICDNLATCTGSYDGSPEAAACDDCCGHGCEDGHCEPLPQAETVRTMGRHSRKADGR
jgi:hypothetical protein